jgi:hypothetical protein
MKIPVTAQITFLLIIGVVALSSNPVSAADPMAVGQIPGIATTESPVGITGTTTGPVGNFTVETNPDLVTRGNILAKGASLIITASGAPGEKIGIWMTSGFPVTRYTGFGITSADESGHAVYNLPNTTSFRSGQYFIYVVEGKKALEFVPDEKDPTAYIPAEDLERGLKAHEQQNPYRKMMVLLEEPAIRMNSIPDTISGIPVNLSGTTNLNAGTLLDIEIVLPDVDRLKQPAFNISGIPVIGGLNGNGSWNASVDTQKLPPGEYIVTVHNASVEAVGLMVLYDSLYDTGIPDGRNLLVRTYEVDPTTKTVINGTPARKAGFTAAGEMLAIACTAGIICLGVIVNNFRKR